MADEKEIGQFRSTRGVHKITSQLAALITFGSGIFTLNSVIGPGLPDRIAILRDIFPLEFLHISRLFTVLSGFALIILSVNVYKRKKRAFYFVLFFGLLSIVFHLAKSLDYEEAIFSFLFTVTLFLLRKNFTVKSSIPDFKSNILRLGLAILVAFLYGVAGFWFLDHREFGINFTIGDSIHRTVHFLILQGDAEIVPHTPYARWFLDSLYLMTITAITYSLYSLFRPIYYSFTTHPKELSRAQTIVKSHGRGALDYFKYWPDKSIYFSQSHESFISYRVGAHYALALGDPVGLEHETETIISAFTEFCDGNDWGLGFHQTSPDFLPVYMKLGFRKLKIGEDAIVDVKDFTLEGSAKKDFRNRINRLEKEGIHIAYYEPPVPEEILEQAKAVSDDWLRIPGRRERGFTLGSFDRQYVRSMPLFGAADENEALVAYLTGIPSFRQGEATIDLMRHRINAPNSVMDYLFVKYILFLKEKGFVRFNLGMAPMSGFQEREDASLDERAIHYFIQHLNFLFSFQGLRQYKAKFATSWEPRYSIYRNPLELLRLALALAKVSEL